MSTPNSILEKVRALLAKAEATEFPAEAEALTAKAVELMARYGIDKAMAEARADVKAKPGNRIFTLTAPYAGTKVHLLAAVARALHCDAVMLSTAGPTERLHVFGFESDIEQADMLYTSLLLQMTRAEARQAYPSWITGRALMAERRSFMIGFIAGVKPRLEAAYATAVAEADDAGTPGKELVLVRRDLAVKAALRTEYPHTRTTRSTYRGRSAGAGAEAGQRANIHNRGSVGTGGRALTGGR